MTWVLAAAPFVIGLALICGFALGRRQPAIDTTEMMAERFQRGAENTWERHWAQNAARETEANERHARGVLTQPDDPGLALHTHLDH